MPATVAKKHASPCRLVYLITGDGDPADTAIANATMVGDCVDGPLKTALNTVREAVQDTLRDAMLYGNPIRVSVQLRTRQNDVTAEKNQISVDIDTDSVTNTKPEINVQMSDTAGQVAVLSIEYVHSLVA